MTVRAARAAYFQRNGFGVDGGYHAAWAEAEFGPFRYRVPNLEARAAALEVHDLHHLVTGYATDWRGESAISAWELGSGWGRYPYAWIIALFGFFTGLIAQPYATYLAFVRGTRSKNLYRETTIAAILDAPLSDLRAHLLAAETSRPRASTATALRFFAYALAAGFMFAASIPFVVSFVALAQLRRLTSNLSCPFSSATCVA